jgi:hypothetical protein
MSQPSNSALLIDPLFASTLALNHEISSIFETEQREGNKKRALENYQSSLFFQKMKQNPPTEQKTDGMEDLSTLNQETQDEKSRMEYLVNLNTIQMNHHKELMNLKKTFDLFCEEIGNCFELDNSKMYETPIVEVSLMSGLPVTEQSTVKQPGNQK